MSGHEISPLQGSALGVWPPSQTVEKDPHGKDPHQPGAKLDLGKNRLGLVLLDVATGKIPHLYAGRCPDSVNGPESRDPVCPACRAISAAESVHAELLNALIQCRNRFQIYVEHHLEKHDRRKAAENERFVDLANEAIARANAAPAGPTITRADVLRLAREAGFTWEPISNIAGPLERFAALVAADVRAREPK